MECYIVPLKQYYVFTIVQVISLLIKVAWQRGAVVVVVVVVVWFILKFS